MFSDIFLESQGIYAIVGLCLIVGSVSIAVTKRIRAGKKKDRSMEQAINGIPAEGYMGGVPGLLERATRLENAREEIIIEQKKQALRLKDLQKLQEDMKLKQDTIQQTVDTIQTTVDTILERSEALTHNGGSSMADQSLRGDHLLKLIAKQMGIGIPEDHIHSSD